MKYKVNLYTAAVDLSPVFCKTLKEARKVMKEFIEEYRDTYRHSGYKRIGALATNYVAYRHPVYGVGTAAGLVKV